MTAIRFYLDEHVPSAIADGLRCRGIDVTMPAEVGLIGARDDAHIAFAVAEERVIFYARRRLPGDVQSRH